MNILKTLGPRTGRETSQGGGSKDCKPLFLVYTSWTTWEIELDVSTSEQTFAKLTKNKVVMTAHWNVARVEPSFRLVINWRESI